MKLVGLTGYIGSGKSTVARIFQFLGALVYDSDQEAKRLMHENPTLIQKIKESFGQNIYDDNDKLQSAKLREIVFADDSKRILLNSIVHPFVYEDFELFKTRNSSEKVIIFESAILLKGKNYKQFDLILFVTAKKSTLVSRIQNRSKLSKQMIDDILKSQKINFVEIHDIKIIKVKNDQASLLIPALVKLYEFINKM